MRFYKYANPPGCENMMPSIWQYYRRLMAETLFLFLETILRIRSNIKIINNVIPAILFLSVLFGFIFSLLKINHFVFISDTFFPNAIQSRMRRE
jgi:hypothetical protein